MGQSLDMEVYIVDLEDRLKKISVLIDYMLNYHPDDSEVWAARDEIRKLTSIHGTITDK